MNRDSGHNDTKAKRENQIVAADFCRAVFVEY